MHPSMASPCAGITSLNSGSGDVQRAMAEAQAGLEAAAAGAASETAAAQLDGDEEAGHGADTNAGRDQQLPLHGGRERSAKRRRRVRDAAAAEAAAATAAAEGRSAARREQC